MHVINVKKCKLQSLIQTRSFPLSLLAHQYFLHWIMGNNVLVSVHRLYTQDQRGLLVKSIEQM